jgi:hypothetical protein
LDIEPVSVTRSQTTLKSVGRTFQGIACLDVQLLIMNIHIPAPGLLWPGISPHFWWKCGLPAFTSSNL